MFATLIRVIALLMLGLTGLSLAIGQGADTPRPAVAVGGNRPPTGSTGADNPRVEPGRVRWHASFADAQVAAAKSGKPVFLFHMMGQLDRQFC